MNDLYPKARSAFARGEINWEGDDFLLLALQGATYDETAEFADELDGTTVDSAAMAGMAVLEGGVCDADNTTLTGVAVGETVEALVVVKDTGSLATSPVVAWIDTNDDTTPISVEGDGSAITINWSEAANRVFRL